MRLLGTDVSVHQGRRLDWKAVAADGVRFAFCKATEHVGYVDPTFDRNSLEAARADILVGSYHVIRPEADPERQARRYFEVAAARSALPPVLDLELTGGLRGPEVLRRALVFVEATEAYWDRPCIVYTANWFWQTIGNPESPEFAARPLWVAHYGVEKPLIPRPWLRVGWRIWQFDGNGGRRLPGVDGDFNWFDGDEDALHAFALRPKHACFA